MMAKGGGQGVVLGYLKYVLGFDSLAFQQGLGDADKRLKAAHRNIQKTADKFANIGVKMSAAITAPLIGFAAVAINEAKETAAAMAQVNAALTSMGPVAGRTADQLKTAADALEMRSLYEGDEILRKVTANLLTFGNVAGANFDRAQQAAVDLATRLGGDLQAATILVGKALNDPIKGMAALGRAGIQFSTDQKAAIKAMVDTGNAAGAQNIILNEFQKQFGGAALAAQNADPFNKASDAFKQMAETVGNSLLPLIPVLTEAVVSVANAFSSLSPDMQKVIIIGAAVAAALGPILVAVGALTSAFGLILPAIGPVATAFGVLATVITGTVIPAIGSAIVALSPILIPLAAVAAAVGAVYLAWRNWDAITGFLSRLYVGVKTYLVDKIGAIFEWLKGKLLAVGGWFYDLYDKVVGHSYIPDMVDAIGFHMARLDGNMVKVAQSAADKTANIFRKLEPEVAAIMDRLFPERVKERDFVSDRAKIIGSKGISEEDRKAALARLGNEKGDWFAGVSFGDPKALVGNLEEQWAKAGAVNDNFARSFEDTAHSVIGSIQSMIGAIKGGDWLDVLGSVVDVLTQLGGAGVFGKKVQGNIAGARAAGGPVSGGRTYLVGERGPELFTASRSGYVHPNGSSGAGSGRVVKFDLRGAVLTQDLLDQMNAIGQQAATAGAQGGASIAQTRIQRSASRRLGR